LKIQSQNAIPTYENNVISNTIHFNNYYIFCDQNASIFFLLDFFLFQIIFYVFFSNFLKKFPFLISFSFSCSKLFITINLFILIFYFFIIIIFFFEHVYFMPNIWVLHKPSKKTNRHFMLQMWVLQNHSNKINVYFVTLMQIFHIELYVFKVLLMQ